MMSWLLCWCLESWKEVESRDYDGASGLLRLLLGFGKDCPVESAFSLYI